MCGIFTLINSNNSGFSANFIQEQFEKGRGRGPEFSSISTVGANVVFGFHRLAINGLNPESNQPLVLSSDNGDIILICNGEIYNTDELYFLMSVTPKTGSDCEVILHLYEKYGIEQTLQMLDGVFSFVLLDNRYGFNDGNKMYVARDPYGVRPLYHFMFNGSNNYTNHAFASEAKVLSEFHRQVETDIKSLTQFPPGHYAKFTLPNMAISRWIMTDIEKYHSTGFTSPIVMSIPRILDHEPCVSDVLEGIRFYLKSAVYKRCCTTERPIACLLSGGLDSSLIAALVSQYHKNQGLPTLETYSIGLAGSEDLKYARLVADHLGTKHTEVILTESDFIKAVPFVIRSIESYDTTTVRASIGNWLLGKYISEMSDAKVIFNGDGSDELCGGYLYMGACPDPIEYDRECRRLLSDIHAFDVLRSDKSISSHGLEPRTPFLDRTWVQHYLSIVPRLRFHPNMIGFDLLEGPQKKPEKYLLRMAFDDCDLLPREVLWRKKEAFSDGVTGQARSLYQILQEHAEGLDIDSRKTYIHNPPQTAEQRWYRSIFEEAYPDLGTLVPYFWMPRYVDAKDASARTLDIYQETNE
jgi:asparagine synthase (glutamine-hydrolysing)